MKIAILTDTHFGARNDSLVFCEYFIKFYNEVFFPYLKKNNIKTIFHLGDVFDRRKYINFQTLNFYRKNFFETLNSEFNAIIIYGNHDIYYKTTSEINSLTELLSHYKNIKIISKPIDIELDGTNVLLVPWINPTNEELCLSKLKNTTSQVVFGHFDIVGFEMYKGLVNSDVGLSMKDFERFDLVLTGHYHHKSTMNNIHYLGSPYEIVWSDYNDLKGFHIFDTKTREIEFIENPLKIFHKIYYNDKDKKYEDLVSGDMKKYENCYLKIIIDHKERPYLFEQFIESLYKENPVDISIIDSTLEYFDNYEKIDETKDTLTLLIEYVNELSITNENKLPLIDLLKKVYIESLNSGEI